ncbi:hypothetical protein NC652_004405 [Populus alba x Populus x berolinensis]|nr:hypothetical protein NC652_004405 [Populus alba x Populus x berolinensis]
MSIHDYDAASDYRNRKYCKAWKLFRKQIAEAKGKSLAQELDIMSELLVMKTAAAVNPYTGGLLVTGGAGNSHATVSKEVAGFFLEVGIEYVELSNSPRFQRMLSEQGEQ